MEEISDIVKYSIEEIIKIYEKLLKTKIWRKIFVRPDKVIIDISVVGIRLVPYELLWDIKVKLNLMGYAIRFLEPHKHALTIHAQKEVLMHDPSTSQVL